MKYLPTYIDSLLSAIQESIAKKGFLYIRERSYFTTKKGYGLDVSILFCCYEAVSTWKFYDYGQSRLCPITEVEFEAIITLTLNTIGPQ